MVWGGLHDRDPFTPARPIALVEAIRGHDAHALAMIKPAYQADGSFLLKQPPNARIKSLTFANSRPGAQDHTSPAQTLLLMIMRVQA